MINFMKKLAILGIVVSFFGCAGSSKYMREISDQNISYTPSANEAVVVFMRPSGFGFAIDSSVFDITTEKNEIIGIVPAKKKLAYRVKSGKHMFMVIGESADFLQADLIAGKTYYSRVITRPGAWKARFSLAPVKRDKDQENLNKWLNDCTWVEMNESAFKWAEQNAASIQDKRITYIEKWNNNTDEDKATLLPEDGF